jgi:hypothetical protein
MTLTVHMAQTEYHITVTEQMGSGGKASGLYSGDEWFESPPGHMLV